MSDDLVTAARKAVKAIDDMRLGISVHNGRMPTSNYPITGPVVNALTEAWIDLNAAIDALPPSIEERKTVGAREALAKLVADMLNLNDDNSVQQVFTDVMVNPYEAAEAILSTLEPLPEAPIPESEEDSETLLIYLRGSLSRTGRDGFVDVPRSYIDQAIALLSSPPIPDHVDADVMGGDWQLIETVPKDGRLILLWDEDCGHPVVAGWSNNHQCFVEQYGGRDPAPDTDITGCKVYLPTHWMPLAAAPKPSGDESGKESGE